MESSEIKSTPSCPPTQPGDFKSQINPPQEVLLNLKATQFIPTTIMEPDHSSDSSPNGLAVAALREGSPADSISTLTSMDITSPKRTSDELDRSDQKGTISSMPPAPKRRKLTPSEKEQQRIEKEAKAAERAGKRSKRDEEKRVRDEERRAKAEAREAKRKEKEVEEEKKSEAKLRKERSQMRLGAFFQKPAISENSAERSSPSTRPRSLSLEAFDATIDQTRYSASPCKGQTVLRTPLAVGTPTETIISDYHKYFLPFHLPDHCSLAERAQTIEDIEKSQQTFDLELRDNCLREQPNLKFTRSYHVEGHFVTDCDFGRGIKQLDIRKLVDEIQGSSFRPVDFTGGGCHQKLMTELHSISRRHIQFNEDIRPAYFGTYTKIRSPKVCRKLKRNPFLCARTDTDYDYDSEAEWQEEEEGEDLVDEEDEDADSVGDAGEMDEFLDDEDDALKFKRKIITGDLVPSSTGLCWQDEKGHVLPGDGIPIDMHDMQLGYLLPGLSGRSIDPFSASYWERATREIQEEPTIESTEKQTAGLMGPPRVPLQPRPNCNVSLLGKLGSSADDNTFITTEKAKRGRKPLPRLPLSTEDMAEFKQAVNGSQLSKLELLKALKTRFSKLTNDTIKITLSENFAQIGASKADKKWVSVCHE